MNIFIIVEGYAEFEFVNNLLVSYLQANGANIVKAFPVNTNANLGKKGGGSSYKHYKKDILRTLAGKQDKLVTTFFDYFELPTNFPNSKVCDDLVNVDEKIECFESIMKVDIAPNNPLFIPYIQKHEFEALLFSSNRGFESYFEQRAASETANLVKTYSNPEEINDKPDTAPSKRLLKIVPEYDKVLGNVIALEIGLDTILEKCPRFNNWIEKLVELARN